MFVRQFHLNVWCIVYARVRVAASNGQISQESPIAALSCDCWVKLFGTLIVPCGCILGATQTMSPNSFSKGACSTVWEGSKWTQKLQYAQLAPFFECPFRYSFGRVRKGNANTCCSIENFILRRGCACSAFACRDTWLDFYLLRMNGAVPSAMCLYLLQLPCTSCLFPRLLTFSPSSGDHVVALLLQCDRATTLIVLSGMGAQVGRTRECEWF